MTHNKMNRILRNIVLWVLFGAGLVVCGLTAFILQSDVELATETILFGAYAFGIISLLAVVFSVVVMGAINDPKSLLKLLGGIAAIAAVVFIAWFLAPGTQPIGYLGDPVSEGTLKLTDTFLNLTYFLLGGTAVALIANFIIGLTRK